MKKLIFIFLLFPLVLSGQVMKTPGRFPFYITPPAPRTYTDVLTDGNTVGWFIAEEEYMTKDDGDSITIWADASGLGHNLLQTDGTGRCPIWHEGDSVTFNGVQQWLKTASFTWDQPEMIYAVIKQNTNWASGDGIFHSNGWNDLAVIQNGSTPQIALYCDPSGLIYFSVANSPPLEEWVILRIVANGSSSKLQYNDNTAVTGTVGNASASGFVVGNSHTAWVACAEITVREIILRKIDDSDDDETLVYNYLKSKYGL